MAEKGFVGMRWAGMLLLCTDSVGSVVHYYTPTKHVFLHSEPTAAIPQPAGVVTCYLLLLPLQWLHTKHIHVLATPGCLHVVQARRRALLVAHNPQAHNG